MTDSIMSKAATMEIPINSNGDTGTLPEDDSLEQAAKLQWSLDHKVGLSRDSRDLQQVMVSGPNLNETSIVSGGYGGTAEGIIPTSSIKDLRMKARRGSAPQSSSLTHYIASQAHDCQGKGTEGRQGLNRPPFHFQTSLPTLSYRRPREVEAEGVRSCL